MSKTSLKEFLGGGETEAPTKEEKPLPDYVSIKVKVHPDDHRRLSDLAKAERPSSLQDLGVEGFNRVLAERGLSPLRPYKEG
ncbi:hypothetical protein KIF53_15205 [Chromobacterium subtsugae]|uniref:Uncharacterized protein n=1 Tax=Chromobacterium subtsugae TaxID=251747 RepID=A0ABS7FFX2_9NEIS|nr:MULTISPECIES: hypothetical protein [Chromobacterium]KUM02803.1 hypothetical protein Cv017_01760 [Chromobacterium subtsugae]KZE85019.1 hypothetical protein AWB61_03305 [Chromobacterium sp. F49]MBW7567753.1 hypothetical protein [Chromobacterium subtsugae]MBW8288979.1 hypothetical protein [Chromobacterium subtsugae]WSE89549.1 hypothetical protein U6115_11690 [Chromobacterium subtsugae]